MCATCFAGRRQRCTVVVADRHERSPPIVVPPPMRGLDGGAGSDRRGRHSQRQVDDVALHRGIARLAARVAEREVNEEEPRDARFLHDVPGTPDDDRRDAGFFQTSRNQTHGLVTHRSKRHEQGDVDTVLDTPRCDLVRIEACLALAVLGRHAEEPVVE